MGRIRFDRHMLLLHEGTRLHALLLTLPNCLMLWLSCDYAHSGYPVSYYYYMKASTRLRFYNDARRTGASCVQYHWYHCDLLTLFCWSWFA